MEKWWVLDLKIILPLCWDLLLVSFHIKADFVTCLQVGINLNIIRSVSKIEHFLQKVTSKLHDLTDGGKTIQKSHEKYEWIHNI